MSELEKINKPLTDIPLSEYQTIYCAGCHDNLLWAKSFDDFLFDVSNALSKKGVVGYHWILISPKTHYTLHSNPRYVACPYRSRIPFGLGTIVEDGILNRHWNVYVSDAQSDNEIIVGGRDVNGQVYKACAKVSLSPC